MYRPEAHRTLDSGAELASELRLLIVSVLEEQEAKRLLTAADSKRLLVRIARLVAPIEDQIELLWR
jgi:hypothetical protein